MSFVSIQPYELTYTATSFQVSIDNFIIGNSLTLRLAFFDADNQFINNKYVKIEGQDYQDLITSQNSDYFILNFVQTSLGITITM